MAKIKDLKPARNIGPGEIIKDYLEDLGWTQEDLSEITDISVKTINQIINHKQGITVDTAKLFAKAFNKNPEFWLNLDNQYRLKIVDSEPREFSADTKAKIRKYMPVLEIQKNEWVKVKNKTADGYKETYKEIWSMDYTDTSVYEKTSPFAARQSKEDKDFTLYYGITWHKIALNRAKTIYVSRYDKEKLAEIRDRFASYTLSENGIQELIKDIEYSGVKFLYQKHLSKTYLDGACFYDGSNPVIVYTARYDRKDHFYFTMAHEIAHVLEHLVEHPDWGIRDSKLEEENSEKIEKEADAIAREMILSDEIISLGQPYHRYFSEKNLLAISREVGVSPDVVLGVLQHEKIIDYRSRLNRFKEKVRESLTSSITT